MIKKKDMLEARREALQRAITLLDVANDYVGKAYDTFTVSDKGWMAIRQVIANIDSEIGELEAILNPEKDL